MIESAFPANGFGKYEGSILMMAERLYANAPISKRDSSDDEANETCQTTSRPNRSRNASLYHLYFLILSAVAFKSSRVAGADCCPALSSVICVGRMLNTPAASVMLRSRI